MDAKRLHIAFLKWNDPRVESAWKSMETPEMSPFLHFDYLRYTYHYTRRIKPLYRPRVACVFHNDEIVMLAALKGSFNRKYWRMLGDIQGCDETNALWKIGLTPEEKNLVTRFFYDAVPEKLQLRRIQADSPLLSCIPEGRLAGRAEKTYVRIPVPEDPDELLGSLSSSVRQNIRTAYNRMRRDGVDYRLEVFDAAHPVSDEVWGKIMDLYFDRLFSQYKSEKIHSWFSKRRMRRRYYKLKHDTLSLHYLLNSFIAVLWNGDRVMAFMNGLTTYDRTRVSIPRLAIDAGYRFYSPGYVLITEVIRYIAAHPTLKELDLSRGDERYKLDMGGQVYSTADIELKAVR